MIFSKVCRGLRRGSIAAFTLLLFSLSACTMLQVAPIQMGRVAQLETFRHTFTFGEAKFAGISPAREYFDPLTRDINQRIERKFTLLLGKDNWQTLKDMYSLGDVRDELIAKAIYIKGVAQIYISIDPYDHQQFLVEGTGKYFLIREKNGAILLSGDFFVSPTTYKIADLDQGDIILNVILFTTRIPGQITYFHEAILKYRIQVDTSRKNDQIYFLKYDVPHDVHLLQAKQEILNEENKLGELCWRILSMDLPSYWIYVALSFLARITNNVHR